MTLAFAYGLFFSFSVFLVPLVEEFRWSRALTAGALSLSTVVQGLGAPVAGTLADRVGPRRVILVGIVLLGAGPLLTATTRSPWELYLYTGVVSAAGVLAVGWVPTGLLLSQWFQARRGRMMGVAFSGMGVGVFVMGPLAQWLISTLGWRGASASLGAVTLVTLLPLAWWGIRAPAGVRTPAGGGATAPDARAPAAVAPADATLGEALRSPAFWALFAAYVFTPLAVFPVATHAVAFAVDRGFSPMTAATAYGAMGLSSTLGRVGFGALTDRIGGAGAASLSFACTAGGALALLTLEATPRGAALALFALLFGLGFGARGPIITAMASERFGGRHFGIIYGVLNLANGLGAAVGPWFGGVVHDVSGSYRAAFLATVVFSALGAACFWLARGRAP